MRIVLTLDPHDGVQASHRAQTLLIKWQVPSGLFSDHKMPLGKKLLNTFHGQGGILRLANDMEHGVFGMNVRRKPVLLLIVLRGLTNEVLERFELLQILLKVR